MSNEELQAGRLTRRQVLKPAAATGAALPLLDGGISQALAAAAAERRGGTLSVGVGTDIVTHDPNDIVLANVPMLYQVYDYLVKFTPAL